jgi:lipooligosaccharide transport system permease protein
MSAAAPAAHALEYWLYRYRRTWRGTVVSSVLNPTLFLAAMGLGLGSLVDRGAGGADLGGLAYLQFLAPGLLAASAMQLAFFEMTWPVLGAVKWEGSYKAMLATPLGVADIVAGHLGYVAFRLVTSLTAFLAVAAAFGAIRSPWGVLALPAAMLGGMAYAAPVAAFTVTRETDAGPSMLWRFAVMPMFLFSGTFFPLEQLPDLVRPLAYVVPLWHSVELCRDFALGTAALVPAAAHVGYLALWIVAGFWIALRKYRSRLEV